MGRNGAPQRTRQRIAADRAEAARLYLMGKPIGVIADYLPHLTYASVRKDVQALTRDWRASALVDMDEARGHELARLDVIEREA